MTTERSSHGDTTTSAEESERITELQQQIDSLRKELDLKNTLLEQLNKSMSEFVYMASHDLMGPARRIQGFAKLLNKALPTEQLNGDVKDFLRFLMESSKLMSVMITDIVHISRLKPNDGQWSTIDLAALLQTVNTQLCEQHPNVKFTIEPKNLLDVYGDADQVERVLQNLLGNAIKFRRPDTPLVISVDTRYQEGSQQIELSLQDNGLGIHQHEQKSVFRPFTRGIDTANVPGSGLGLALCTRICQIHHGNLWLESSNTGENGECSDAIGTDMRLCLPAAPN